MSVEERIQRLEMSVQGLIDQIERLPGDVLYGEPGPGEWSVMSTLAHVSELLPYWGHQIERVVKTPGVPFGRTLDDPDRLGAITQHGHDTREAIVARLRASLDEAVKVLRGLPAEAWASSGLHPIRGTMTVEQIVDTFMLNHAEEHAAQTRATLSALGR